MTSLSDPASVGDGPCGVGEKQCRKCGGCFPATTEYFARDKKGQMGLHYWCKACTRANARRYKKQNYKQVRAYNRRWHVENSDYMKSYKRQYREEHREEIAEWKRQCRADNWEAIAEDKRRILRR